MRRLILPTIGGLLLVVLTACGTAADAAAPASTVTATSTVTAPPVTTTQPAPPAVTSTVTKPAPPPVTKTEIQTQTETVTETPEPEIQYQPLPTVPQSCIDAIKLSGQIIKELVDQKGLILDSNEAVSHGDWGTAANKLQESNGYDNSINPNMDNLQTAVRNCGDVR